MQTKLASLQKPQAEEHGGDDSYGPELDVNEADTGTLGASQRALRGPPLSKHNSFARIAAHNSCTTQCSHENKRAVTNVAAFKANKPLSQKQARKLRKRMPKDDCAHG